jgi:AMP-binding enzyme
MIGREECSRLKSAGRLVENVQVKIVDPNTGMAMSVGQEGELWVKSPACMTGRCYFFFFFFFFDVADNLPTVLSLNDKKEYMISFFSY